MRCLFVRVLVATVATLCALLATVDAGWAGFTRTGQPGWFTFRDLSPAPDVTIGVNVASGALLVTAVDVRADPATDHAQAVRYYNTLATGGSFGPAWSLDLSDARMVDSCAIGQGGGIIGPNGYRVDGRYGSDYGEGRMILPAGFEGTVTRLKMSFNCTYSLSRSNGEWWSFGANNRLGSVTDASGRRFSVYYDTTTTFGNVVAYGRSSNALTRFTREGGQPGIRFVTDPSGAEREYRYDGRLTEFVDPEGRVTRYSYDANGYLNTVSFPDGSTVTATHDAAGKVTELSHAPAGEPVQRTTFTYDVGATTVTAPTGYQVRYVYDAEDRVVRVEPASDITPPDLDVGGELWRLRAEPLTGDTFDLWADAEDASSGVRAIEIKVDGAPVASASQTCPGGGCDLEKDWTFLRENFAIGQHTVDVVAADVAANVSRESFAVNLSPDRTPAPGDDETAIASIPAPTAHGPGDGCASLVPHLAPSEPFDVTHGDQAFGGETVLRYRGGHSLVIRCTPQGRLIKAQHIGPVATPDGTRDLVLSQTAPLAARPSEWVSHYATYRSAEDLRRSGDWARWKARALGAVMTPTVPLPRTAPPAASASAALAPTTCVKPAPSPDYQNTTWLGRTWEYRIIVSSFPGALGSTESARNKTLERIRDGIRTWNRGDNDCQYPRFEGFGTAMVKTRGATARNHEDGISAIEFVENLTCPNTSGIVLGCTSRRQLGGGIPPVHTQAGAKEVPREADVQLRGEPATFRNRKRERGCSDRYDLWNLASHEIGHVVGLGDLDDPDAAYQTMYQGQDQCTFTKRKLARGDYIGLQRMYTPLG